MSVKVVSAERGKVDGGAQVSLVLVSPEHPSAEHILELHMDKLGVWWPVVKLSTKDCQHKDIQQLRVLIAATLQELAGVVQSAEAGNIKVITDMISK